MYGEYEGCMECKFRSENHCLRIGTIITELNWCKLFEPANQPLRTDNEPE